MDPRPRHCFKTDGPSRMLLSTAIALAREIGCFDNEQVLARPRSAGTALKNSAIGLEWSRILYTFLCLTDEALALRLRLEPLLASTNWTEMVYSLPPSLMGDGFLESAVDLTINMRKARELLLAWRKSEHCGGSPLSAAAWDSFRQGLDCWESSTTLADPVRSLSSISLCDERERERERERSMS